ncbi:Transcription factor gsfR2 [Colletotrichum trifolii]|uniref:Transcription factor gsfR2 n=1 Tax=Colletotrichum trifolii TaxID=5466 RepID=A0A4R8R051_COLTR|nr:Transcription factor gsfR2 [Colletotrichum trifolii]
MVRRSKQKSCFPCVESKRRCDRTLPSCTRCLDRDVECAYVPARRTRRLLAHFDAPQAVQEVPSPWDLTQPWTVGQLAGVTLSSEHNVEGLDPSIFTPEASGSNGTAPLPTSASYSSSSSTSLSSIDPTASNPESELRIRRLTPSTERLCWFLVSPSWEMDYQQEPSSAIPPAAVFTNFVRGLQSWLSRFLRKGHNPFIHRHLYSAASMPRCMQDAYAAIAVAQNVNPDNEHVVDSASSTYVLDLLASSHSAGDHCLSLLSTREHLARTQALLIHLLLSLFSPSIPRRAKAESLIDTLRAWARQMWDSATLDASTTSAVYPNTLSLAEPCAQDGNEVVPGLYRAFVLSESIRRTFLLTSIATGVYSSLQQTWQHSCHGDVCITARAELWDAASSARWEAVARKQDPLFMRSLQGYSMAERGVPAADVDEFARLLFTVMWGLEKVERVPSIDRSEVTPPSGREPVRDEALPVSAREHPQVAAGPGEGEVVGELEVAEDLEEELGWEVYKPGLLGWSFRRLAQYPR